MRTLMDEAVDVGTTMRLSQTFTTLDAAATPIDPGNVALLVKDPNGGVRSPTLVRDSTGNYHAELFVATAGQWRWRWQTQGPERAKEGSFIVRRSEYVHYYPPLFDTDEYALIILQNETFERDLFYTTSAGTAIDLTGLTARAQARSYIGGPSIIEFTTTVIGPNEVRLSLTHDQTKYLSGSGVYDVWLIDSMTERWTPLIAGPFIVRPSATLEPAITWGDMAELNWGQFSNLTWGQFVSQ